MARKKNKQTNYTQCSQTPLIRNNREKKQQRKQHQPQQHTVYEYIVRYVSFPNNERKRDCGNAKTYLNRLSREFAALLSLIAHIATGKRNIFHKYAFQQ